MSYDEFTLRRVKEQFGLTLIEGVCFSQRFSLLNPQRLI